jgi:hypothetical protein
MIPAGAKKLAVVPIPLRYAEVPQPAMVDTAAPGMVTLRISALVESVTYNELDTGSTVIPCGLLNRALIPVRSENPADVPLAPPPANGVTSLVAIFMARIV